jgi:hypothetical protein
VAKYMYVKCSWCEGNSPNCPGCGGKGFIVGEIEGDDPQEENSTNRGCATSSAMLILLTLLTMFLFNVTKV